MTPARPATPRRAGSPRRAGLDLAGRTVLITGGASGIGAALARAVTERGARAAIVDRAGAEAAAAALTGAVGVAVDVCDREGLAAACATVAERTGGIDVVIANAGVGPSVTTVLGGDEPGQQRVLDVNLQGVWNTVWAAGPHVRARDGHLALVASVAAFLPAPTMAAYGVSKAGVAALGRALRIELAGTGTTVTTAFFGLVDTPLMRTITDDPLGARVDSRMPALMRKRSTAEAVATALVDGIERRRPRVIHPPAYRLAFALDGLLGPLADASVVRDPGWRRLTGEIASRHA